MHLSLQGEVLLQKQNQLLENQMICWKMPNNRDGDGHSHYDKYNPPIQKVDQQKRQDRGTQR